MITFLLKNDSNILLTEVLFLLIELEIFAMEVEGNEMKKNPCKYQQRNAGMIRVLLVG